MGVLKEGESLWDALEGSAFAGMTPLAAREAIEMAPSRRLELVFPLPV